MKKLFLILIMLNLCSCSKTRSTACVRIDGNNQIYLDIRSNNDDITQIRAREVFVLPYSVILNDMSREYLEKQLDDTYHFEDNLLVKEYDVKLYEIYSLSMTLNDLKKELFVCE